jgi:hypothetical protein
MFLVKFDILPMVFIWKDWGKYDEKPQDSQNGPNFEQEIAWTRNRSANRDVHYQCRIFDYPRRLQYELYRTVAARGADRIPSPVESCHTISGNVKRKRLNCLILRAVAAGALEELKKFGTYYIAGSPIVRVNLRLLQETFPPLGCTPTNTIQSSPVTGGTHRPTRVQSSLRENHWVFSTLWTVNN